MKGATEYPEPTRAELAWLRRLQKLVDTMPKGTWVFVNGDPITTSINLMRPVNGCRVMDAAGNYDQYYSVGAVSTEKWDCGGF